MDEIMDELKQLRAQNKLNTLMINYLNATLAHQETASQNQIAILYNEISALKHQPASHVVNNKQQWELSKEVIILYTQLKELEKKYEVDAAFCHEFSQQ